MRGTPTSIAACLMVVRRILCARSDLATGSNHERVHAGLATTRAQSSARDTYSLEGLGPLVAQGARFARRVAKPHAPHRRQPVATA